MTSLPAAVTVVAWFAALVVSVPSSSHGGASVPDSVQQNHTTVLSEHNYIILSNKLLLLH